MMDEFELDEGTLYGAEDTGLRSGLGEGAGAEFQGEVLNDSDDESNTVVDLGDSIHGGPYRTPSHEFSGIAPIPENGELASIIGAADIPSVSPAADFESLHKPIRGIKMGSSAPISIPMGMRSSMDIKKAPEQGVPVEEKVVSATFIPPHMIGSVGDFQFNWEGASPAAVLKKDKLRVRNQIMAATGYLDQGDYERAQTASMSGSLNNFAVNGQPGQGQSGLPMVPSSGLSSIKAGGLKAAFQAQR